MGAHEMFSLGSLYHTVFWVSLKLNSITGSCFVFFHLFKEGEGEGEREFGSFGTFRSKSVFLFLTAEKQHPIKYALYICYSIKFIAWLMFSGCYKFWSLGKCRFFFPG